MNFVKCLKKELDNKYNVSNTENNALGYKTTGRHLLDLHFQLSSLRNKTDDEIVKMFIKAFYEDIELSIRWLFYIRDIREGCGERRTFRIILFWLATNEPEITNELISLIAEYGRWDDLWVILDAVTCSTVTRDDCNTVFDKIIATIANQLSDDLMNMGLKKPISLLAKWMPSVNTSSVKTVRRAKTILKELGLIEKDYRRMLSKLRKYLDITEVKMSANKWGEIDYEAVPSRANLIYNSAFFRHDEERRREFLNALEKGEAKINAEILFPHDIVTKYMRGNLSYWYGRRVSEVDPTLEALWKSLPNTIGDNNNTIVVADGSGSMASLIGGTSVTALDVANALAIYFAERMSGQFKDKYITFSNRPQIVDLSHGENLCDKILTALKHNEVSNTDIEAVFNLILKTAIDNNMSQAELPKNILIISDMEFDEGCEVKAGQKLFDNIAVRYKQFGYKLPRLVFWNLMSRTGTIPVKENDLGVALISGFSPNVMNMVMNDELDPYKCLLSILKSKRYDEIGDALKMVI